MANDRSKTPTLKTHGETPRGKRRAGGEAGDEDPTRVFDSGRFPQTPPATIPLRGEPDFVREAATPIRVKSMKTPGEVSSGQIPLPADAREARPKPQVKLRAISEVAKPHAPQEQLGYLAPPRDPNEVRSRRRRDFVVWGSICVILACAVALGIWFAAK